MQQNVFVKSFDAICPLGDGMDEIFENLLDKRCKIPQDERLKVGDETLYAWRMDNIDARLDECVKRTLKDTAGSETAIFFVGKEPNGNFKSKTRFETSFDALKAAQAEIKSSSSKFALVVASFEYDAKNILELFSQGIYSHAVARPFDLDSDGINCSDNISVILLAGGGIFEILATENAGSLQEAVINALEASKINAEDIDYIEACANGFTNDDRNEAAILSQIFGQEPFVSSSKGFCGHSYEASMLLSLCIGLIALEESIVFASSFLEHGFTNELNFSYANRIKTLGHILVNSHEKSSEYASIIMKKIVSED